MAVRTGWKSLWSLTLVGGIVAASLYAMAPRPALAHDDGEEDIFSTLLSTVGLGPEKTPDAEIDYRERAPLVVPPTMDLPPPQTSAVANPAWPKDPDVVRRAKALALAHQVSPTVTNPQRIVPLTQAQMAASHDPTAAAPLIESDPSCNNANNPFLGCQNPNVLWGSLATRSSRQEQQALAPGVEPTRAYLTDPPSGYRVATKAVKVTPAAPEKADTSSDPAAYYRDQALRSQSRDGLDN